MLKVFAKSSVGFSHIERGLPCQDFSSYYKDSERIIISCCDGHGGDAYIRSKEGSKFASNSVLTVFKAIDSKFIKKFSDKDIEDKIKLQILCEWNRQVEEDIATHPFKKREIEGLDEDKQFDIRINPVKAYGTTLSGAILINNKLIVVSIGDGECSLLKSGQLERVFDTDDDPVGNITYSMCQEDAFSHLRVRIVDFKGYDGLLLNTDGLSGPYQTYANLLESFVKPLFRMVAVHKEEGYIDSFIDYLAHEKGTGDDVSIAYIINDKFKFNNYK